MDTKTVGMAFSSLSLSLSSKGYFLENRKCFDYDTSTAEQICGSIADKMGDDLKNDTSGTLDSLKKETLQVQTVVQNSSAGLLRLRAENLKTIIGSLKSGDTVTATGKHKNDGNDHFLQVTAGAQTGWVHSDYVGKEGIYCSTEPATTEPARSK